MTRSKYIRYMSLLETMKPIGDKRARYKIKRAWQHYIYIIVSWIENVLIKSISIEECDVNKHQRTLIQSVKTNMTLTASLTTFPARINEVEFAIKSIMLQTVPPDRIVLWLADTQFPNNEVPQNLMPLMQYGLEVRFCDDLRSHKKYYYALQEQKENELVITFDDDIIYHPHTIERLLKTHYLYPNCIICSAANILSFSESKKINYYYRWKMVSDNICAPSKLFSPLTGSGCLYPYRILNKEVFDKNKIYELAFSADDLWIFYMSKLSQVSICVPNRVSRIFSVIGNTQHQQLSTINCLENGNDQVIDKLQKVYPIAFDNIQE